MFGWPRDYNKGDVGDYTYMCGQVAIRRPLAVDQMDQWGLCIVLFPSPPHFQIFLSITLILSPSLLHYPHRTSLENLHEPYRKPRLNLVLRLIFNQKTQTFKHINPKTHKPSNISFLLIPFFLLQVAAKGGGCSCRKCSSSSPSFRLRFLSQSSPSSSLV